MDVKYIFGVESDLDSPLGDRLRILGEVANKLATSLQRLAGNVIEGIAKDAKAKGEEIDNIELIIRINKKK